MIPRIPLRFAAPIVAAVAIVPWIVYCARTYADHALYFDQSMYQYTGWSIRNGESLYETVAVPDGPFITWLHAIVQSIAGESDAAFRWADLVIQTTGAGLIGFAVAPYGARRAWTAAIAALWLAQYFRYDWHWTAQREAYYALAGYLGMALLVLASRRRGRATVWLSLAGGLLVGATLFGKHIGLIFVALGCVPALCSPGRRVRLLALALGGVALAIAIGLVAVALTGSVRGFVFWYFTVPRPYRYIMGSGDPWPLLLAIDRHTTIGAGLALVGGAAACWWRVLPWRYAGFVVAPALFLVAMLLQRKGHIYQGHPITAGTYVVAVLVALHLMRRARPIAYVGVLVLALVTFHAVHGLARSTWIDPDPPSATSQLGAPHVNHGDIQQAARKLAEVTRPGDRVFAYGPAGRLLYEAKRAPAVPPFNNFFLNVRRAAIIELTPEQRANLERVQRGIARRSCPRLNEKPAAVVVCDGADWSGGPGLADATEICDQLAYVRPPEYEEVGHYGCWRVFARQATEITR